MNLGEKLLYFQSYLFLHTVQINAQSKRKKKNDYLRK